MYDMDVGNRHALGVFDGCRLLETAWPWCYVTVVSEVIRAVWDER
jgi:hypothetical protein